MSDTESYVIILYNHLTQLEPMVLFKIAVNCNNNFSGFSSKPYSHQSSSYNVHAYQFLANLG